MRKSNSNKVSSSISKQSTKQVLKTHLPSILGTRKQSNEDSGDNDTFEFDFNLLSEKLRESEEITMAQFCNCSSKPTLAPSQINVIEAKPKCDPSSDSHDIKCSIDTKETKTLGSQSNTSQEIQELKLKKYTGIKLESRKSSVRQSRTQDDRKSSDFSVAPFAMTMSFKCKIKGTIEELNYEGERVEYLEQLVEDHFENIDILQQNEACIREFVDQPQDQPATIIQ